jgi:hypothetical protein
MDTHLLWNIFYGGYSCTKFVPHNFTFIRNYTKSVDRSRHGVSDSSIPEISGSNLSWGINAHMGKATKPNMVEDSRNEDHTTQWDKENTIHKEGKTITRKESNIVLNHAVVCRRIQHDNLRYKYISFGSAMWSDNLN